MLAITFYFIRQWWARTDQCHLTTQEVEELWQLIQAGFADKPADSGDAGIINLLVLEIRRSIAIYCFIGHIPLNSFSMKRIVGPMIHRSEFEYIKFYAVQSYTPLTEKDGAIGI